MASFQRYGMPPTLAIMPTYNLGQSQDRRPTPRWEDIPEESRQRIVDSLAGVREMLAETLRPTIDAAALAASLTPRFQFNLDGWMPSMLSTFKTLQRVADTIRLWVPNWSERVDGDKAWALTGEGIPLAFVPRTGIVEALIAADDHESHTRTLLVGKELIIEDCRKALALDEDDDPYPESIGMLPELLHEAIDVLEQGHYAASSALGVAVIDSALHRTSPKAVNYPKLKNQATKMQREEAIAANDYRVSLAMRPMQSLLTDWRVGIDQEAPTKPSRHVVAHWAQPDHMTETNAIIIVMAATSLFLGLAEREAIAGL